MNNILLHFVTLAVAAYPPMGETIIVEPTLEHTHTVIFLHGITHTGEDMAYLFRGGTGCCGTDGGMKNPNRKAVLPTAPIQWNEEWGKTCHSWFGLYNPTVKEAVQWLGYFLSLDLCALERIVDETIQTEQVDEVADIILEMAEKEAALLASESSDGYDKVFIGGFSQGAMTSLSTLMRHHTKLTKPIAGYFILSGMVSIKPEQSGSCSAPSLMPQPEGD